MKLNMRTFTLCLIGKEHIYLIKDHNIFAKGLTMGTLVFCLGSLQMLQKDHKLPLEILEIGN